MPVVTPDDVAAGFLELWNALPHELVTGGLHHQRAPNAAQPPYAVMTIEDGDTEEFSGGTYLQKFIVRVAAYTNTPTPNSGPIRREAETAFRHAERREGPGPKFRVPNADQVLHVRPVPGGLEYAPQTKDAQNVVVPTGAWEVLIQADRNRE